MIHHPLRLVARPQSGSAVLAALGILVLTLVVVGAALFESSNRFRTSNYSSRWSQAGHAAESGAEIAMMTLQKSSWLADGWSGTLASGLEKTAALSTAGSGSGTVSANIRVSMITMGSEDWINIHSTGVAEVTRGTAGMDTTDNLLRKLSLRTDRTSGANLTTPRATRTCEVLAARKTAYPFKYMFASKELFDIHTNTVVDSFDSSDPTKSNFGPFGTYGVFDLSKRQENGMVATTDALHTWNLNNAHIYGDVHSPNGSVSSAGNVHGTIEPDFVFEFPVEVSPAWTTLTTNHGNVNNITVAIVGGAKASPPRHKMSEIKLDADNKSITIKNPVGVTESWVEVWVTGDTSIADKNGTGIKIDPGVHCTIHFGGKVDVKGGNGGYAIENGSKLASNLVIFGYGGSSGSYPPFTIANSDFWGVVSAPWYKVKFDMTNKHVSGSILGWQFDASDGTNLHYDEGLGQLGHGFHPTDYEVKSWVEAVR